MGKKSISAFTIIVLFLGIALIGMVLTPKLPIKLAPSSSLPSLTVRFSMPQNSSRVIEMTATSKLEAMLARVEGVKKINSTSGNGWGYITLELDKHTPIDAARFETSTIVRQTWPDLPRGTSYPSISIHHPDEKASKPFITFTINSPATPIVIQRYAENKIKPRLNEINGLYDIKVQGATPMEWQLCYDSDQLQTLGVTINDIKSAISRHYTTHFLGISETKSTDDVSSWMRVLLTSEQQEGPFDASAITVKSQDGTIIHLDQLVTVTHAVQTPQSYYRINGLNSIFLSLTAEETANQLELSNQVHKTMDEIRRSLPPGYEIHSRYDATEYIHTELNKIYLRSGLTVLILLLFVFLITRNVRYLSLIVVSLTVNIAIAIIFYYLFGLEMQLYSLAGITISLSLIIDNTIIMTDHMLHRGNRHAFMAILAATTTTVGALSIIFFLDEKIRLNLQDFAAVVIVNLCVSLAVALFFVPALIEKMHLKKRPKKERKFLHFFSFSSTRFTFYFNRFYSKMIHLLSRRKWIPFTVIILLFGFPVFLIPDKIENESHFATYYNKVFDNSTYKENIKPILNKTLGGTLRLFSEKVIQGSYFTRNEETVVTITSSMPNGTTLSQMNVLVQKMERYISSFPEIRQFQTTISSPLYAYIQVFFNKESERTQFPYQFKSNIIAKALELGGGSWGVYGLEDNGFNNNVRRSAGSNRVIFWGYNYDELEAWADTFKKRLLSYRRIKEVTINSGFSYYKDDYKEFVFDLKKDKLIAANLMPNDLFNSLRPIFAKDMYAGSLVVEGERENIKLSSKQSKAYDIWALKNTSQVIGKRMYRLSELAAIAKEQVPQQIVKENQQYRLCLQYDYIGSNSQGTKLLKREVKAFNKKLPMGYTVKYDESSWNWGSSNNSQYWLIGLLIVIIFFTTSVLFNSLKQPLAVIFIIPVSFIGVFLTFYWFHLNFDQGGFASFILLSGITVNASIYILNEYNCRRKSHPNLSPLRAYLKAWNTKIIPIFLTVVSTMLGFVPFMVGTTKESFWFPLAAGSIGGLLMSMIGLWIFLPLMMIKKTVK